MGKARAVIIAFENDENLRLVFEFAERFRMDNAITVALITPSAG